MSDASPNRWPDWPHTESVAPENTGDQQADGRVNGRFHAGQSGNPRGRPKGSLNRSTLLLRDLLADDGEEVVRRAIADAKKGKPIALRLVLERLVPPATSNAAVIELPAVAKAADVAEAAREIIAAAARGELTLAEAREWMALLERQRLAIETQDLTVRLEILEEQAKARETREKRRR
jgi:Family of unknown function (DUF5681)